MRIFRLEVSKSYYVNGVDSLELSQVITEKSVHSITDTSVWFTPGVRVKRLGATVCYFETYQEAKDYLTLTLSKRISSHERKIAEHQYAANNLQEILQHVEDNL